MITYTHAVKAVKEGFEVGNDSWPKCKKIRPANAGDHDFFVNDVDLSDAIIEDCPKPCDCSVGLWIPTEEDKKSEEYFIVE